MVPASGQLQKSPPREVVPAPSPADAHGVTRLAGEVVYMYAFDVAYEMSRRPVRELLGQPVAQFVVDADTTRERASGRALRGRQQHASTRAIAEFRREADAMLFETFLSAADVLHL